MQSLAIHRIIEGLAAIGMSKAQAEMITENTILIAKDEVASVEKERLNLVTKDDLKIATTDLRMEMGELKSELKGDIAELKSELKGDIVELRAELKGDIVEIKRDMKWGMALLFGIFGLLIKVAFF